MAKTLQAGAFRTGGKAEKSACLVAARRVAATDAEPLLPTAAGARWGRLRAVGPGGVGAIARAVKVERLARAIEALAVKAASPKRGCLTAMVHGTMESDLLAWGKANIPDEVLDPEEGRETETHVTVLYGFDLDFDIAKLMAMLRNNGPAGFTLGRVGRFECEKYDVIKVEVRSRDFIGLNAKIAKVFADGITSSEHEYNPHLTLAYVRKGACKELDGREDFNGRRGAVIDLLYSLPEKKGSQTVSMNWIDAADHSASDTVKAAGSIKDAYYDPLNVLLDEHSRIRDEAQRRYQRAVNRVVATLEASAIADLKRKEAEAKKKKRREEELEALALLLFLAGAAIYASTSRSLAQLLGVAIPWPVGVPGINLGQAVPPQPTNAPTGTPGALPPAIGVPGAAPVEPADRRTGPEPEPASPEEAEIFAESRGPLLENFPAETAERLDRETEAGRAAGESDKEIARRLARTAENIETGRGKVVAETEAQATYGDAQQRLLVLAGFETKIWETMRDERVRESHVLCGQQGEVLMDATFHNGLRFPGDPNGGPEEVCNCFPAETMVEYPGLHSVARRWHSGDMIEVSFAGGSKLAATPNHPILRSDGAWIPISQIEEGDNCIGCSVVRHLVAQPHVNSMPSKIGDIYSAANKFRDAERITVLPPDFHGDVTNGNVDIVSIERELGLDADSASDEQVNKFGLALANQSVPMLGCGDSLPMVGFRPINRRKINSSMGSISGRSIEPFLFGGASSSKQLVGFCSSSVMDAEFRKAQVQCCTIYSKLSGNSGDTFASKMAGDNIYVISRDKSFCSSDQSSLVRSSQLDTSLDEESFKNRLVFVKVRSNGAKSFATDVTLHRVVDIKRFHYDGYVFNLDTGEGYYTANGIATQNCRCWLIGGRRKDGSGHLQASEPVSAAHIGEYQRNTPTGGVATVHEHEDNRGHGERLFDKLPAIRKDAILWNVKRSAGNFAKQHGIGKSPTFEYKRLHVADLKPTQWGEDRVNDSSKETARALKESQHSESARENLRVDDYHPILVHGPTGKILDGNHRHAAAEMLGDKHIHAVVVWPKDHKS